MTYQDLIGTLQETGQDYWAVRMTYGSGIAGRALLPAGAWNVRVNAYAQQSAYVGYVARVDGAPSWDYSGVNGCSETAWASAPWEQGQGTLQDAVVDDWQAKKVDGTASVIASNVAKRQALVGPRWLYLMPLIRSGSVYKLEIFFHIQKAGWQGWDWNKANAQVMTYPHGPKFLDYDGTPLPLPPIPDPPPNPVPINKKQEVTWKPGTTKLVILGAGGGLMILKDTGKRTVLVKK